jgi:hypothetical protein
MRLLWRSTNPHGETMKTTLAQLGMAAVLSLVPAFASAQTTTAPVTPATDHHGLPNNNPAFGGGSANPRGTGANGGANIHGIGNVPGQDPTNTPTNGEPGFRDQLGTVHGGLGGQTGGTCHHH